MEEIKGDQTEKADEAKRKKEGRNIAVTIRFIDSLFVLFDLVQIFPY